MSWLKSHPLPLDSILRPGNQEKNDGNGCSDTESVYSNERASNRGSGTDETLAVTRVLEEHDIPCCLVGISALVFYGPGRARNVGKALRTYGVPTSLYFQSRNPKLRYLTSQDWELYVPTELVDKAVELLQSEPYAAQYRLVKP